MEDSDDDCLTSEGEEMIAANCDFPGRSDSTCHKLYIDHDDSEHERLHISKNFDPWITDYAHRLGHSPIQVVRDKDRPRDLDDSMSSTTIAEILASYNCLDANDDFTNKGSESDEEIVLYPRLN
ncbi:hypothetical protein MPER_05999 [Moniliophthora perniciosa FA553]|nr:hypothetical protein MPER_05999 [Moniliophthora perniciosa FA553]